MKRWRSGLPLTLALISIAPLLHAAFSATYTASPTVPVPTGCFPGPGDLQSCLDIAADDPQANMVLLQPGTYSAGPYTYAPGIDDDGGALVIQNEGAVLPVLNGGGTLHCLNIDNSGLPDDTGADITVTGIVFQDCFDTSDGGALEINTDLANITIDGSNFFDNTTTDDDGGAAELGTNSGHIIVRNSLFERNKSTSEDGGALDINSDTGNVDVIDNTFNQNFSTAGGGALFIFSDFGNVSLQGNTFTANESLLTNGGNGGGAYVESNSGAILISTNLFSGNKSGFDGGGLYMEQIIDGPGSITVVNNIFAGNQNGLNVASSNSSGGGLTMFGVGTDFILTNNTFFGNTSQASNNVAVGGGVSISLDAGSTGDVYNNIIYGNSAQTEGSDIYVNENNFDTGGGTLNLFNNDYTSFFSEALDNSGLGTVNQGNNLIGEDPLFVDSANGDFNLTAVSPVIDKGDPMAPAMPATDFADNPRPAVPGTNPDMGALEFQPEPTPVPTPSPTAGPSPFLLQGTGCSLEAGTLQGGVWMTWAWLLAAGAIGFFRKNR